MKHHRLVPAIVTLCVSAGCGTPKQVKPDLVDASAPDPVEIHGKRTGGGGESSHGVQVPLDAGPLTLIQNNGQLEITSTATDNESGIKTFMIYSNDRHCRWNGNWATIGAYGTKTRDSVAITPDGSGMVPVTVVALANIQVGGELGVLDKVTWEFFGTVTNFAGKTVNIGPIHYTAVSDSVPAGNRMDGCP
jgi:hypothetical protein